MKNREADPRPIGVEDESDRIVYYDIALIKAGLDPFEFRAYQQMAFLCRGRASGQAFQGLDSMAKECQMSKPTLLRAIKTLLERAMIKIKVQGSGRGNSTIYALTKKEKWKDKLSATLTVSSEDNLSTGDPQTVNLKPVNCKNSAPYIKEINKRKEKREKSASRAKPRSAPALSLCDSSFLEEMSQKYPHFDINHVYAKFLAHCEEKGWKPTKERGRDWFKRERAPVAEMAGCPAIATVPEARTDNTHIGCSLCQGSKWELVMIGGVSKGVRPCPGIAPAPRYETAGNRRARHLLDILNAPPVEGEEDAENPLTLT